MVGIPKSELLFEIKGNDVINGTYGHSKLLIDVCSYLSPRFRCRIGGITEAYAVGQGR